MIDNKDIVLMIKDSIKATAPNATVILYGSQARGDNRTDSDLDLLILLDKEKITREDEKNIKYPLYEIEFETGKVISPLVLSKSDWETRHRITPFYENVSREGIDMALTERKWIMRFRVPVTNTTMGSGYITLVLVSSCRLTHLQDHILGIPHTNSLGMVLYGR